MYKSGKITVETVAVIVIAVCALLSLGFMIFLEYRTSMIAVVEGGQWEAPQSVVTDLMARDGKRTDPNRIMTAKHALDTHSLYIVNIRNKSKHKMKNPQMSVPSALHWDVSWKDIKGDVQNKEYSVRETIALPPIECMKDIDVKVWTSGEVTRPNEREILVTQDGHGGARLDIRTPVWELVQSLSQHIRKVWIGFGIVIAIIAIATVVIIWRQHISSRHPQLSQPQSS